MTVLQFLGKQIRHICFTKVSLMNGKKMGIWQFLWKRKTDQETKGIQTYKKKVKTYN
jgi:hypothetical protein